MSDQTIQETNPVEPTPEIQEPGNLQPEKKPKGRKKAFRYVSMLVVVVIVLSGIFMLWWIAGEMKRQKKEAEAAAKAAKESQKADQEQQEKPKVKVYKVSKGEFIWVMETLGTIEAKSKVELRFEVNGIVDTINNKEGDQVKEGDILAEINHEDAELKIKFRRSKLEEARIEEKNWKIKVDQNKVLMDNGALTPLKHEESVLALERAKQGTKSAKIELDSAQSELEKTYLKCPIDGMVRSAKIQKGEYVTSQTKVMEIMEINEVHCEFQVLEKDIQDVHKDLKISLSLDAYPGEMFSGS
ncbi:MAG: efflux RND transporter periplasmic adaptor subunit, partial [Candidatus Aureabacteria bacterium]|nr:efflux RND transporter periplasmic adaptor subunit [Candidatus Auribacterota bacterium]